MTFTKIIQVLEEDSPVLALADDNKIYRWSESNGDWELHKTTTVNDNVDMVDIPGDSSDQGDTDGDGVINIPILDGDVHHGIAVSGLEFAERVIPGANNNNYKSNGRASYDLVNSINLKYIRLPFITERFSQDYLQLIKDNVDLATERNMKVWLDFHNYGRNYNIADRVTLAQQYKDNPTVECIEIDNEPHGGHIGEADWYNQAKLTVKALRDAGWDKLIAVPMYHWSSMDWFADGKKSTTPPVLDDPKVVYVFHNYFNAGNTGFDHPSHPNEPAELHVQRLQYVIDWARNHGVKLAITEYGVPPTQDWIDNAKPFVRHINANSDIITHAFYWATGEWYNSDTVYRGITEQLIKA